METSRDDVGIAIRSAFLRKGTKQRFSIIALVLLSILLIFVEKIETKPLNSFRSIIKDLVYRSSLVVSSPGRWIKMATDATKNHFNLYKNYNELKKENLKLKGMISNEEFLVLENMQLRKLIDEQIESENNLISSRVMLDKKSPYNNSFIVNSGGNKGIKNGMAVLDGKKFIGRIVDVNFFSSRVLLVSDLNSKIPVIVEPSGNHAILSGRGKKNPTLDYLPKNHEIKDGSKVFTSGKEGIFTPGIPIGEAKITKDNVQVLLFSDLSQVTFVNISSGDLKKIK